MKKISFSNLGHSAAALVLSIMPIHQAWSAPLTLPSSPLFLSTIVDPNIFFTLDDSGSMDWEITVEAGAAGIGNDPDFLSLPLFIGTNGIAYLDPTTANLYNDDALNFIALPPSNGTVPAWDQYWVMRNHNGNKLYYNPEVNYEPWVGAKTDGTPMYPDAIETAALNDPNDPTGHTVDLTTKLTYDGHVGSLYLATYFIWDETTDLDHIIDQSDNHQIKEITPGTDEMQNFANWYVYYRSRINTTKAIIGGVINNTDTTRMGSRFYNQGLLKTLKTMTDTTNKRELLEAIYGVNIGRNGTPSRTALVTTGEMFINDSSAILPQADGGECQQHFNILMTDGFWNNIAPNVGNADGDDSSDYDGGIYADNISNTLADVAMHYYETDLSGLDDKVPTLADVDENPQQHLVNYTVAFGVNGGRNPDSSLPVDNPLDASFIWPTPVEGTFSTVDDLWHAAYNSRGKYLNAQNPTDLESALTTAISNIAERTATAAAVAVNSAQLSTESVVYLAQFNTNRWQGNLSALSIVNQDTGELSTTPNWVAEPTLSNRDISGNPRTIITYDTATSAGIPFQWGDLVTNMINDLQTTPSGGTDANGEARLNYIRGDRTQEGSGLGFRKRLTLLGDLVNSGPVFVGAPSLTWPDVAPFPDGPDAYSTFKNGRAKSRQKIVYVGANDGMLHAFDDATYDAVSDSFSTGSGAEVFAYIPGMSFSATINKGLHYLADPNYVHNYYVDLTPSISDIYIGTSSGGTFRSDSWKTVLIGGMRGGGRGYYALDITNPSTFAESAAADMVLWEFTDSDDIDVGYSYSRPTIALTNAGTWVAIFGNGYNATGTGSTGEASLFIVDIEAGTDGSWDTGDYRKITTGVGSVTTPNGLATPALADVDGDGTVDRVYAGDLEGNMWAFDLTSASSDSWDVAYSQGTDPKPLFTTVANRPITARPVLANHPTQPDSGSNQPNLMVFFGTGKYLETGDLVNADGQAFYGVWDSGTGELTSTNLIQQSFDSSFAPNRVLTQNQVDYSFDDGWYFLLTDTKERAVTSPIARGDIVFFNSFVPEDDPCTAGGYGYKFAVDMGTGGSRSEPTLDSNNDGIVDEKDLVNNDTPDSDSSIAAVRQEGYLPEPVFIEDLAFTGEEATKVKALPKIRAGRFSWQELLQ